MLAVGAQTMDGPSESPVAFYPHEDATLPDVDAYYDHCALWGDAPDSEGRYATCHLYGCAGPDPHEQGCEASRALVSARGE